MVSMKQTRGCGWLRPWLVGSVVFVCFSAVGMPIVAIAGAPKVTICHRPPGNPENEFSISVGATALASHLDHGDSEGGCSGGGGGLGGGGTGGPTSTANFTFILCDRRAEESGRSLQVNVAGRGAVDTYACD